MIVIIGAGPSGLFAAEHLATHGHQITVYDQMPTPARKFLLAGRGGLNLTHSEPLSTFTNRYGPATNFLTPILQAFPPTALTEWCENLGQPTFTGTSGRIFPQEMKAAPLLRAWLRRLADIGVQFAPHHQWLGWSQNNQLRFATPAGEIQITPKATLLALGGASWPRMGSNAAWVPILQARQIPIIPLRPTNCGILVPWSETFKTRFAGIPLKRIAISIGQETKKGEAIITAQGLEGGAIYALSAPIRHALDKNETATIHMDLRPDIALPALAEKTNIPRGSRSLSNFLRQSANLSPVAIGLIHEALLTTQTTNLAALIKSLPITITGTQPIARAISTSGGISLEAIDENLMLRAIPGTFAAGEMLDWEAPTGGYLLQACFSTGLAAARGIQNYLMGL